MRTGWTRGRWALPLVAGLVIGHVACGGDEGTTMPPPVPSPTATPAPTPTPGMLVARESFTLEARQVVKYDFTTTQAGDLDVTVTYGFADSDVLVWVTDRACGYRQFERDECDYLTKSLSGPTPRALHASGVAAGTYTIFIHNNNQERDEQMTFEARLFPR